LLLFEVMCFKAKESFGYNSFSEIVRC